MHFRPAVHLAVLALVLVAAGPAQAGSAASFTPRETIGDDEGTKGSTLSVDGDGTDNALSVATAGANVTVTDPAGVNAGKGCTQKSSTSAECPSPDLLMVDAKAGSDTIQVAATIGAYVQGGQGDDAITAGFGHLSGDEGNDTIESNAPAGAMRAYLDARRSIEIDGPFDIPPSLYGGSGDDTLQGGSEDEQLWGEEGSDQMNGGGGSDYLVGLEGSDTLSGGDGDDRLQGDSHIDQGTTHESDTLDGGPGTDTLDWAGRTVAVIVDLSDGAGPSGEPGESERLSGLEVVLTGSGVDTLKGGAADETFRPAGGKDSVDGGTGSDSVSYQGLNVSVRVDLADPAPDGPAGDEDTLVSIEGAVGGEADDVLLGDAGANTFVGQRGDDRLVGAGGDDLLYGFDNVTRDVLEVDEAAEQSERNRLEGGDGDDRLFGGFGPDSFDGGRGDDALRGEFQRVGGGFVYLGFDTADYSSRKRAVTARLGVGGGERGEADTYSSIEGINGGSGNDVLTGRKKRTDRLAGGAGADTLNGRSGKDYLLGGRGADTVNAFDGGRDWSIKCGRGSDRATVDRRKDKPRGCERVRKRGPR